MAKKVANGMNKRTSRARNLTDRSDFESGPNFETTPGRRSSGSGDYQHMIRELISNPAVKYVAGGIATAILSRLAQNMSEKYPELSRFLRENIDNFEGRLGQYRPSFGGDERESRV
jgi:hypothetical protein